MGRLKLNVDGAYVVHTGATCVGIILRNNEGAVRLAACRSLKFCSSALDVELQACLMGVRLALDHSNEDLIVDTDSLELVRMA
jgi:ribonuclease HI